MHKCIWLTFIYCWEKSYKEVEEKPIKPLISMVQYWQKRDLAFLVPRHLPRDPACHSCGQSCWFHQCDPYPPSNCNWCRSLSGSVGGWHMPVARGASQGWAPGCKASSCARWRNRHSPHWTRPGWCWRLPQWWWRSGTALQGGKQLPVNFYPHSYGMEDWGLACLKGAALKVVCNAKRKHKFLIPIMSTGTKGELISSFKTV